MTDPLRSFVDSPTAVPVKDLPGAYIRETGFEEALAYFDRVKAAGNDNAKLLDASVRLIIASVCDENAVLKYTDADREWLAKLPLRPINALASAILDANGLSTRAVESAAKNS